MSAPFFSRPAGAGRRRVVRSAGVADDFARQGTATEARIRRCLDDYAATADAAHILGEAIEQDAASLLAAGFRGQADAAEFRFLRVQQPLLARLFWQRFLSRSAVRESEPMANVRVVLTPREAGQSDPLYEMALSGANDLAATRDLVTALWLYAIMRPERIDEVPAALRPLWQARRDLSERRFWRHADQVTQFLEEFDRSGDAESPRQALECIAAFQRSAPGMLFHLTPQAVSRYVLLYCDTLVCRHAAGEGIETLEAALSGLRDGLAQGTIGGQDRFRAAEIIMRVGGIHLTGLACVHGRARAQAPRGCALPEVHWGVPGLVRDRCRLPGLPGLAAVAGRLRLPEVRAWRLGRGRWRVQVRGLRQADVGDGGHAV